MILVCLTIFVLVIISGAIIQIATDQVELGYGLAASGGICAGITLVIIVVLCFKVTSIYDIDKKIELYEAQNAQIESKVTDVVEKYMEHENKIFTDVAPNMGLNYISMYPELKTDVFMQKQIAIYLDNNDKITKLKEERITAPIIRWWLYFGE